jgi:uncharacterized integral membrane protein (TIGR00698 family)
LTRITRLLPGLGLAVAIALVSRVAAGALPAVIAEVLIAVLLGILIANLLPLPAAVTPGVRFAVGRVLRFGIILLGARLSLAAVLENGLLGLAIVVIGIALALGLALWLGTVLRVPKRMALLIGVGTAICGNSAIIATAPVLDAEEREVSFAVATITLFGTLAVFAYPLIGRALGLSEDVFGLWAGAAVNDTAQVVATAAAYGPQALDVATVVKLTRNALMAVVIVGIGVYAVRSGLRRSEGDRVGWWSSVEKAVPLFVIGFLAMAALNSLGLLNAPVLGVPLRDSFDQAARLLILVALAAVGLQTRLAALRSVGPRPLYLGLAVSLVLATSSLGLIAVLTA